MLLWKKKNIYFTIELRLGQISSDVYEHARRLFAGADEAKIVRSKHNHYAILRNHH